MYIRNPLLMTFAALAVAAGLYACGTTRSAGGASTGSGSGGSGSASDAKPARAEVWCDFGKGYAALLPKALYDPKEDFLMQILIGLHEGDNLFDTAEYAKYKPFAATPCEGDINGRFDGVEPGEYMLLVGWVGRYDAANAYENNGWIKAITLEPGGVFTTRLEAEDLTYSWSCISCPYLSVAVGDGWVELGHVLRNRRSPQLGGTDTVDVKANVSQGIIRMRLDEKEPETTYLDAVSLKVGGKEARLLTKLPIASTIDGRFHTLGMGDSLVLEFAAPAGTPDGAVDAVLRITGHYVPAVDL